MARELGSLTLVVLFEVGARDFGFASVADVAASSSLDCGSDCSSRRGSFAFLFEVAAEVEGGLDWERVGSRPVDLARGALWGAKNGHGFCAFSTRLRCSFLVIGLR